MSLEIGSDGISMLVGFLTGMFGVKMVDILTDYYYYKIRKLPVFKRVVGDDNEH